MFIYSIVFIMGIFIGSFLNVCIYRIPYNQSIVAPGSHCYNCSTPLKPFDLIPIISYVFLRGKCRYCGSHISIRYPMVELLTGIIFLLLFYKYSFSIMYYFLIALVCILLCIAFIDYDHLIIPDELILFGFVLGLMYKLVLYFFNLQYIKPIYSLLGILVGGGLFLLIAIISKGGMGGGDIKLMGMLGFWFGWKDILLISLLSFIIGSLVSIFLLLMKFKNRKDAIPFGPFIIISTFIVLFFSEQIVYWYFNLFLY